MPLLPRRPAPFVAALSLAVFAGASQAAAVNVVVTDTAGNPLADAVVMLEAASDPGVRPMTGVQIAQHNLRFDPQVTVVTVGTPVTFPNQDTVRHHVYSFSAAKSFQLKLYAGVPHAPIVFDKPGIAVLGCNIHDQMVAWVVVVDTPYYARGNGVGHVRLDGVPPGSYQMRIWHQSLAENAPPMSVPLVVGASDVEQRVRLVSTGPGR